MGEQIHTYFKFFKIIDCKEHCTLKTNNIKSH